jgi:hypothetical protein
MAGRDKKRSLDEVARGVDATVLSTSTWQRRAGWVAGADIGANFLAMTESGGGGGAAPLNVPGNGEGSSLLVVDDEADPCGGGDEHLATERKPSPGGCHAWQQALSAAECTDAHVGRLHNANPRS